MTIPAAAPASLTVMQPTPIAPHRNLFLLAAACWVFPLATVRAQEPPLRDLLRDGLYAEEVTRDPEAAAKPYEQILARFAEQRELAATALFRLAEVRRKQDRKDDAIALYQRLLADFPASATLTKLARENLAALGANPPEPGSPSIDEETKEIGRLTALAKTAPDLILDPETLSNAAEKGWSKAVGFLLGSGSRPYAGGALMVAAENGYLEIVKQLTAGDGPVPAEIAGRALRAAMDGNRTTLLEFLLQKGLKPGKEGALILTTALTAGRQECADLLVKHGADLNATAEPGSKGIGQAHGTALAIMIYQGNFAAATWLLEKGAKPDVPDPDHGVAPLHYAALGTSDASLAMMQTLLAAGADPNRYAAGLYSKDDNPPKPMEGTSLLAAIHSDFKIVEKVQLLVKHGANPNVGGINRSQDRSPLRILAEGNNDEQTETCLKLLVDAGATPDDEWRKNNFRDRSGYPNHLMIEAFTLPAAAKAGEINLVIIGQNDLSIECIANRATAAKIPDLAAWLLDNPQKLESMRQWTEKSSQWVLWRKDGHDALVKQEFDLTGNQALPPLQWGDVIEVKCLDPRSGIARQLGLSPDIVRALSARIAFPISVEIEGKSREITVRGNRIVFDPTKNEVPQANLQQVVQQLCQLENCQLEAPGESLPTIHVVRQGWPDVRLSYGSMEARAFKLESGDRLKIELSGQVSEDRAKARGNGITLKGVGYPYTRFFGLPDGEKPVAANIPTLIEALVDAQVPMNPTWMYLAGTTKASDLGWLHEYNEAFIGETLLPHPDFQSIRIHRPQDDGTVKVLDVNLAKTIAASNDATTVENARKADVKLLAGDVVEISLLKEHLGEPWKGFTPKEEAFFAKALSGRVQVTDDQGNMTVRDIVFNAQRFIETPYGWIPGPPESGIPSTRACWLFKNQEIEVTQGELTSGRQRSAELFLRDGDRVRSYGGQPQPRPVPGQPVRTRPRVVAPPPPNSR